jgi:predicted outer membrane repeat protein
MKKHLLFGLLVSTFLTNNAFATEVKVNAKYLNNLSSKVKWTEAKEGDEGAIKIGDKYYTYTYTKPSDYTKATEHISYNLSESDVDKVLFEGFTESYGGGAIYANNSAVTATGSTFRSNTSGYYGGAIRVDTADLVTNGTTISQSKGATGAALYLYSGATLTSTNDVLDGNEWDLEIRYSNGKKPFKSGGCNDQPYNFDELLEILGIEEDEEDFNCEDEEE